LDKKKKLESLPKLEGSDLVEMLQSIHKFRQKTAKLQTNGLGAYGGPYSLFEPLFEFYEACAVEHYGENKKVREYFSASDYALSYKDKDFSPVEQRPNYYSSSNDMTSNVATWLYQKVLFMKNGTRVPLVASTKKGEEGEKIRRNDGEHCYGDKKKFLEWMAKIPTKADPAWDDLLPVYKQALEFYQPVISDADKKAKLSQVPAEIENVKQQSAATAKLIEQYSPKIKSTITDLMKIVSAKTKKEAAKQHPAVQLLQAVRDEIRDCKLVTYTDKDLLKALSSFDASLDADVQRLISYYNDSGRGGAKNQMLFDYELQDVISRIYRSLAGVGFQVDELAAMYNDRIYAGMTFNSNVKSFLDRWNTFGQFLGKACGAFENPLYTAYLEDPSSLPDGAEACQMEMVDPNSMRSYGAAMQDIKLSLADMKQKFPSEKERFAYIKDLLLSQQFVDNNGMGSSAVEKSRFPTYHDLAKELSEKDCVKAIFVSRVQELDLPKTVFDPGGDASSVRVVWKGTQCQ
jgi:hypothetical protein